MTRRYTVADVLIIILGIVMALIGVVAIGFELVVIPRLY